MRRAEREDFRKGYNYYLALASELANPLLGLAGTIFAGAPTPRESWRKGLIISHTHVGDVLYRTASLAQLADAFPDCSWDYLASPSSAPVLDGNESISDVLPLVTGEDSWSLSDSAFSTLRDRKYDVALCTNSLRHYPDFALAVALGIPNRVGYSNRGLSGLLTHPIDVERPQPFPAYFREMVKQLTGSEDNWSLEPKITITAKHRALAESFLAGFGDESGALVACCPTTRQGQGAWPERLFIDAVNAAAEETQLRVLLCGSADQRRQLERVAAGISAANKVMAGDLDILSFAALLSRCDVILAQDSAARHLGNAVGTPVVFLRNLSVNAVESGVYCSSEEDAAPAEGQVGPDRLARVSGSIAVAAIASRIVARIRSSRLG